MHPVPAPRNRLRGFVRITHTPPHSHAGFVVPWGDIHRDAYQSFRQYRPASFIIRSAASGPHVPAG